MLSTKSRPVKWYKDLQTRSRSWLKTVLTVSSLNFAILYNLHLLRPKVIIIENHNITGSLFVRSQSLMHCWSQCCIDLLLVLGILLSSFWNFMRPRNFLWYLFQDPRLNKPHRFSIDASASTSISKSKFILTLKEQSKVSL